MGLLYQKHYPMENEKNPVFEDFMNFVNQTNEEKKQEINIELYDKISLCVEQIITSRQSKNPVFFFKAFEKLKEISLECKINEITDILLYERIYNVSSKEYSEFFSDIVISHIYGKSKSENFQYIENIIFTQDNSTREQALIIYIIIAKEHAEYQLKILNFVERNYQRFSQNQKVLFCMLTDEKLSHSPQAKRIKKLMKVKEYSLIYKDNDTPETNQNHNSHNKKWWEFWK